MRIVIGFEKHWVPFKVYIRNNNFNYSIHPSCPNVTLEMQLFISFQ